MAASATNVVSATETMNDTSYDILSNIEREIPLSYCDLVAYNPQVYETTISQDGKFICFSTCYSRKCTTNGDLCTPTMRHIIKTTTTYETVYDVWSKNKYCRFFTKNSHTWFGSLTDSQYDIQFIDLETKDVYKWGNSAGFVEYEPYWFHISSDGNTLVILEVVFGISVDTYRFYDFSDPSQIPRMYQYLLGGDDDSEDSSNDDKDPLVLDIDTRQLDFMRVRSVQCLGNVFIFNGTKDKEIMDLKLVRVGNQIKILTE